MQRSVERTRPVRYRIRSPLELRSESLEVSGAKCIDLIATVASVTLSAQCTPDRAPSKPQQRRPNWRGHFGEEVLPHLHPTRFINPPRIEPHEIQTLLTRTANQMPNGALLAPQPIIEPELMRLLQIFDNEPAVGDNPAIIANKRQLTFRRVSAQSPLAEKPAP